MKSFWVALQFLTRLPCPKTPPGDATLLGRSVLSFPLVGALIGLILYGITSLLTLFVPLSEFSTLIACLLLVVWVVLSGALHLDGLGDSADAWLGGGNDRQRCFEIMHDPRSGTAAIVSIVLVLLIKFSALEALLSQKQLWPLLFAPIIGRGTVIALLLTTPNAQSQGIAVTISKHLPRPAAGLIIVTTILLTIIIFPVIGSISLLIVFLITILLRRLMMRRLGGLTGDTCGAVIEITEASVLVSWTLLYLQFI